MPTSLDLIWARYDAYQPPKFYLLLFLVDSNNYTLAMEADKIPSIEITSVRVNIDILKEMPTGDLIAWIKEKMPVSYKQAIKKFHSNKLVIRNSFSVKQLT